MPASSLQGGDPVEWVSLRRPLGIRPTACACWAEQSRPDRLPATYMRTHGVTYFHGC